MPYVYTGIRTGSTRTTLYTEARTTEELPFVPWYRVGHRRHLQNTILPKPILFMRYVLELHQSLRRNDRQVTLGELVNRAVIVLNTAALRGGIPPEHNPEIRIAFGQGIQRRVHGLPTIRAVSKNRRLRVQNRKCEFIEQGRCYRLECSVDPLVDLRAID